MKDSSSANHGFNNHDKRLMRVEKTHPHVLAFPFPAAIAFRSIGAVGNQKGRNSYDQDFCVERHRPVARIKTVARDTLVIRR